MIDLTIFEISTASIQNSGYFVIFLLMFFEGPLVTYISAFLASQGVFSIYIIILLSLFGDLIPDTILFLTGKYSRNKTIEKIASFFGLSPSKIERMEKGFSTHSKKSIMLFKLIPGLALPGLILAGFSKVSLKDFFLISIIFNICSTALFVSLGFYSGITISTFLKYLRLEKYLLVILLVLVVGVYMLTNYIKNNIKNKL